jgi:hypothetical protein
MFWNGLFGSEQQIEYDMCRIQFRGALDKKINELFSQSTIMFFADPLKY